MTLPTVNRRKLLCLRKKTNLDLDHKLLFEAYKGELKSLVDMATRIGEISLDPISTAYSGLTSWTRVGTLTPLSSPLRTTSLPTRSFRSRRFSASGFP